MDRIEELMRNSDPARGIPAPGPLTLDSPHYGGTQGFTPTFVETADRVPDKGYDHKSWYKKPAVWIAGVAAAAVVGTVWAFNPFGFNNTNPLPGENSSVSSTGAPSSLDSSSLDSSSLNSSAPNSSAPNSSASNSSSSTPSGTSSQSSAPSSSAAGGLSALPNGLKPAHANVFWEDSEECKAFDPAKLITINRTTGAEEAFVDATADSAVAGCYGGFATVLPITDRQFVELNMDDAFTGMYVARWNGEKWMVEEHNYRGAVMLDQIERFPRLRDVPLGLVEYPTLEAYAKAELAIMDIQVDDIYKLLGPDLPIWTEPTPASAWDDAEFTAYSSLTGQKRSDWDSIVKEITTDGVLYETTSFFDRVGTSTVKTRIGGAEVSPECEFEGAPYNVIARQDIELTSVDGPLSVALVNKEENMGARAYPMLIRESLPQKGELCALPFNVEITEGKFIRTMLTDNPLTLKEGEEQTFLESQYWKDVVQFASTLRNN